MNKKLRQSVRGCVGAKTMIGLALTASVLMGACGGSEELADAAAAQEVPVANDAVEDAAVDVAEEEAPDTETVEEPSADAGLWDVCSLLSNEEVSSTLGVKVEGSSNSESSCDWIVPGADLYEWDSPKLHVAINSGGVSTMEAAVAGIEEAGEGRLRELEVGDKGYEGGGIAMFTVGDAYVQLMANFTDTDFSSAPLQGLAKQLASRI